ncbi:MAG: B12-binding domain-containing radical SAM protein [Desulfobacterales bacterium]|nr:B12-binding domain-containing radical SAM protein [Desulfobacterales bacterium]
MKRKKLERVLFVYPNSGALRIPLAVAILSAILRETGVDVRVFDTTFFKIEESLDYTLMEKRGVVKKTRLDELMGDLPEVNISRQMRAAVEDFDPDLILVSVMERHFWLFDILVRACKGARPDVRIIAGGILPTLKPEMILDHPCVDYVAHGEGEDFVRNLVRCFGNPRGFDNLPNLLRRDRSGRTRANAPGPLADMNAIPFQDWSDFDRRQLLKPYDGNVWIGGSFELSRGCFKSCTFCVAPQLRCAYGPETAKRYHRTKDPARAVAEIKEKKERLNLTFLAMCDTDFLFGVPYETLAEFCRLYKAEIGIPWIIQGSAESFSERKLAAIVDAGCVSASIGVESGSPRMRREVIKKRVSLGRIKKTFDLCRDYNFRTTANYMIGLPYETEADVRQTIALNRQINPPSVAITYFTPFLGTELYDLCVAEGFYDGFDPHQNVYKYSPLKMPQLSAPRIEELIRIFMDEFESFKSDIHNLPPEMVAQNNRLVDQVYGPGGEQESWPKPLGRPGPDARTGFSDCHP